MRDAANEASRPSLSRADILGWRRFGFPALRDLVSLEAPKNKAMHLHLLPEAGLVHRQMFRHITLSPSAIISRTVTPSRASPCTCQASFLIAFGIGRFSPWAVMIIEIGGHVLVDHMCLAVVHEILVMPPDKVLHLRWRRVVGIVPFSYFDRRVGSPMTRGGKWLPAPVEGSGSYVFPEY